MIPSRPGRPDGAAAPRPAASAASMGVLGCPSCLLACRIPATGADGPATALCCPRCGATLHGRRPRSAARCQALLLAAAILYAPANLLPIMRTELIGGVQRDTIMSGVAYLWTSGAWLLAALVFFASVMVPLLKLISLAFLLATVRGRSRFAAMPRLRLYRLLEFVGRWSMLDIYVVTLLAALVRIRTMATISVEAGAVAFGAVVVLTMLATLQFDPRLIWDSAVDDAEGA